MNALFSRPKNCNASVLKLDSVKHIGPQQVHLTTAVFFSCILLYSQDDS